MIEENWVAIIDNEDRLIASSDRRFRYHCYSLESMSEELTYQERSLYVQNDFTVELLVEDFIDTVQNEKLAVGHNILSYITLLITKLKSFLNRLPLLRKMLFLSL